MVDKKPYETCSALFVRRKRDSAEQWSERSFCSVACSNDSKKDKPPRLRFWAYVDRSDGNRCWLWNGPKDDLGYGRIHFRTHKAKAHRVSYEMRHGPIPNGMVVCHACDNPSCVNPNHLFVGTQADSMQDASRKGRLNPKSLQNLRPGASGCMGAGPYSNKELKAWQG